MIKKILLGLLILITVAIIGFVATVYSRYERTFEAPYLTSFEPVKNEIPLGIQDGDHQ